MGSRVCVADVDEAGATSLAQTLREAGHTAMSTQLDVADPDSCVAAFERVVEQLGAPTILVNNAGVMDSAYIHKMSDKQWSRVHDVVLRGTFNCTRAVAPWFRAADGRQRRIVNITSLAGIVGGVAGINYISAKAGVIGMTKAVSAEWAAYGVTVNAVAPGLVTSRMSEDNLPAELRAAMTRRIPLGRIGTPEDIAGAVAFLCSDTASYITGQVLEVSGGLVDLSPPHGSR